MNDPVTSASLQQGDHLQALLAQMGSVLLTSETLDTTISLVTALAARTIPATTGAGLSLIDSRGKRSVSASNRQVEAADALQYELDSGPCMTAAQDRVVVRVDDVATDPRWPRWSSAVASLTVRSVLSVPLDAGGTGIGAIKVYSDQPGAFDRRAEAVLELFARQAAILLTNTLTLADAHRTNAQLTEALENRDLIGQAKGILLDRGAASETEAFEMLVTASQHTNVKLHEVARQLVASLHDSTTAKSPAN